MHLPLVSFDRMVRCISPSCRKEIDEQFYFCPFCGTDNRAPENRFEPADHQHQYPAARSYYCIWCGDQRGVNYLVSRPWRKPLLHMAIGVALLVATTVGITAFTTYSASKPGLFGFGKWCRTPVEVHSRRHSTYMSTNGLELIKYELLGVMLVAIAYHRYQRWRGYWD